MIITSPTTQQERNHPMKKEETVRVGIQDRLGDIRATVSLADLVATGDNYQLYLMNEGKIGSSDYELLVQGEDQMAEKIRLGRLKREEVEQ
jgi:hypothetical protein